MSIFVETKEATPILRWSQVKLKVFEYPKELPSGIEYTNNSPTKPIQKRSPNFICTAKLNHL